MTGRTVDIYTNIATVKLFSHSRREQAYAREAMDGFLGTVDRQMRLATITYSLLYALNMALVAAVAALSLWLLRNDDASAGMRGGAVALALGSAGRSAWTMWGTATSGGGK